MPLKTEFGPFSLAWKGEKNGMKKNPYSTNQVGTIKAPKPVTNDPKSTVKTGDDLRAKKGK